MREIKFRIFYKYRWFYATLHDITDSIGYDSGLDENVTAFMTDWGDVKTRTQFVGLKDTNGKEIYSGDILRVNGVNCEVFYDEDNVCFCLATDIDYNPCLGRYEIIGNKFEHPNLLKDEQEGGKQI